MSGWRSLLAEDAEESNYTSLGNWTSHGSPRRHVYTQARLSRSSFKDGSRWSGASQSKWHLNPPLECKGSEKAYTLRKW